MKEEGDMKKYTGEEWGEYSHLITILDQIYIHYVVTHVNGFPNHLAIHSIKAHEVIKYEYLSVYLPVLRT